MKSREISDDVFKQESQNDPGIIKSSAVTNSNSKLWNLKDFAFYY